MMRSLYPLFRPNCVETAPRLRRLQPGALPTLIELSDMRGDLHMHTEWSDGRHSMREMVCAAQACGHDYIAITDHSVSSRVANGLTLERLHAHMTEVRSINEEVSGIEVLAGSEVDILTMEASTMRTMCWRNSILSSLACTPD